MQLRSGRRLVLPAPAPQGEGGQRRSRRCPAGGGNGDGKEDRISGLPEELLLQILGGLECASEAVRTSVLAHRWRGLWAELRELRFRNVGADEIELVLARVRPKLDYLEIGLHDEDPNLTGARISSLLRAADWLAPAELNVSLYRDYSPIPITFELPSFASATSIDLFVSGFIFTLAPAGEFALLEQLALEVSFCTIDLGALLPRCPRLQKLRMNLLMGRPIDTIVVESKSLKDVEFRLWINGPGRVVIVAPELKKLILDSLVNGEFTVSPSAPKMEEFLLDCTYDYSCVGFGGKWRLHHLRMETEWSHRNVTLIPTQILSMRIIADNHITERSLTQEIARLPVNNFSVFILDLKPLGHDFGPLMLQLLRIRTSIQKLKLILSMQMFQECSENCHCDQGGNWRTEPLSLPDLEDVEIQGFSANGHEVDFLELVFRSAPMLKRVTIQLSKEVPTDNGGRQRLDSMFEANASVKCSVHDTPDEEHSD